MDNHDIDYLSIDNWMAHNLSSPRFPEQKDTNKCGIFVMMNIFQILKYKTMKQYFSANDMKPFRDDIFDIILHVPFEKHEGMMNNNINNTVLVYTINEDEIAKVREELENEDNGDNNTNDKNIKKRCYIRHRF